MNKLFSIMLVIALLGGVVSVAFAQGTRSTAFQIVNLGSSPASLTISYYDDMANGGAFKCSDTVDALASFASVQYNQDSVCGSSTASCICNETSWSGSVVIESTEIVAVITNVNEPAGVGSNVYYAGGSYNGIADTRTADTIVFPFIMHEYANFNTDMAVQNAGGADAALTLTYYATGSTTATKTEGPITIAPGASYYRNQKTDDTDLPAGWNGVVVASTGVGGAPIAGVVNENPNALGMILNYEGFASGASTIYMPFLAKTYANFSTAFQVVALENGTAGTISFYPAGSATPVATKNVALDQYGSLQFNMKTDNSYDTGAIPDGWSGAGVINLTSGTAVVIVNERGIPTGRQPLGLTYSGMNNDLLKANMTFPFVIKNYAAKLWSTAFQVVNVGTPGTVTVHYDGAAGFSSYSWTSASLDTNVALECNQKSGTCIDTPLPDGWNGSVRVEGAAGVILAGICNERSAGVAGDNGLVYNGFPYDLP
jgi:hypothetical protein